MPGVVTTQPTTIWPAPQFPLEGLLSRTNSGTSCLRWGFCGGLGRVRWGSRESRYRAQFACVSSGVHWGGTTPACSKELCTMSFENFPLRNGTQDRLSTAMPLGCGLPCSWCYSHSSPSSRVPVLGQSGEQCTSAKVLSRHPPKNSGGLVGGSTQWDERPWAGAQRVSPT